MEKNIFNTYWKERKKGFFKPKGKRIALEALIKIVRCNKKDTRLRILDIGCGDGYIINKLSNNFKNLSIDFYGIDKCKEIIERQENKNISNRHCKHLYVRNILQEGWDNDIGSFDIIICINSLHEIFTSLYMDYQQDAYIRLETIISCIARHVEDNGILLIFDGIENSNPNECVEFCLKNQISQMEFDIFKKEYSGIRTYFDERNGIIYCKMKDFTRFITKKRFLSSQTWEIEKNETYQYYTYKQFLALQEKLNLQIIHSETFICNETLWHKDIKMIKGRFPMECACMIYKRL
ncbi:class I SAM-dependent methyltransferase [Xylanibacter muris]|uniref:Class I SAM-dependent methyltransferase n=1 Tax=Xylanibacter muris TaxID=2736290 RepID=A0ABX2AJC3_9BACT|nr:class I SAM-dependent methyltransferase [Xylanibacter muris]NPD91233.1 class I SAM-dependent methyltransferase [Xylanibacter muris]